MAPHSSHRRTDPPLLALPVVEFEQVLGEPGSRSCARLVLGFRHLQRSRTLGLPELPAELVTQDDLARLSAALVRITLDDDLARSVRSGR